MDMVISETLRLCPPGKLRERNNALSKIKLVEEEKVLKIRETRNFFYGLLIKLTPVFGGGQSMNALEMRQNRETMALMGLFIRDQWGFSSNRMYC